MTRKAAWSLAVVLSASMAIGLSVRADDPAKNRLNGRQAVRPVEVDEAQPVVSLDDVWFSTRVRDDGRWEIAGVTGFSTDETGQWLIEVKPYGDFELDTTLVLDVPYVESPLDRSPVLPIESIRPVNERYILTVPQQVGGVAIPTPPDLPQPDSPCHAVNDDELGWFCLEGSNCRIGCALEWDAEQKKYHCPCLPMR